MAPVQSGLAVDALAYLPRPVLLSCGWAAAAGAGTTKGRAEPLVVSGSYDLRWHDYSDLGGPGGRFRYLYVPIAQPGMGPAGAKAV